MITDIILTPQQNGKLEFRDGCSIMSEPHRHDELEFNLVIRGTGTYLLGGRRYEMHPQTLVWFFPAQEHILLERTQDFQSWLGVFSPRLLKDVCRSPETQALLSPDPPGHFCRLLPEDEARALAALLARASSEQGAAQTAGLGYAALSAWDAFGRADGTPSGTHIHPAVERAAQLIRDETDAALSLPH